LKQLLSVRTVAATTVVLSQNSGVREIFIGCALLVSADVSQLIQRIIGIGWLTSADTINHIFGISYTVSVDTNNVQGIRGVTPPMRNANRGEIWFCAVSLPNIPTLYVATSIGVAPPRSAQRHLPRLYRRLPLHRTIDTASLGASVASLEVVPSPSLENVD
jgi:hypothetical protein